MFYFFLKVQYSGKPQNIFIQSFELKLTVGTSTLVTPTQVKQDFKIN